mgnify:CR=1 FL=1
MNIKFLHLANSHILCRYDHDDDDVFGDVVIIQSINVI